jgi:tetratricopeptide (TPR) repeat protein
MIMQKTILATLPQIFESPGKPDPGAILIPLEADSRWVDSVAHIAQFSGRDIPQTSQQFESMLRTEQDPAHRAVLYAGIARCYNSQMKLKHGAELLGYAWSLLDGNDSECTAFVLLEMVRFMVMVGNTDAARLMLERIPHLTQSEYLLKLADYYRLADMASQGQSGIIERLDESAEWFMDRGQIASVVAHYRMLASLYRAQTDDAQAAIYYKRGLELVGEKPELQFCRALLFNDSGLMKIQQGNREDGFKNLQQALALAEYPYSRIDTLDLMGNCLKDEGRLEEAEACLMEAFNIAIEQGTIIIVPALALYLGEIKERQKQQEMARHFYHQAHKSTMELLGNGFPATKTRLKAIEEFIRFSTNFPDGKLEAIADPEFEADFSFALSHTIKEMRTIFHKVLLDLTSSRLNTQRKAVNHLGIAPRTVSNVRQRYQEMGFPEADPVIVEFVQRHPDLNWKEINQKFDDKVLNFVSDHFDGDRKQMSDKLGISYPHLSALLNKTKSRSSV